MSRWYLGSEERLPADVASGHIESCEQKQTFAPCVVCNTGAVLLLLLPGAVASCCYSFVTHTDVISCWMVPFLQASSSTCLRWQAALVWLVWFISCMGESAELSLAWAMHVILMLYFEEFCKL